MSIGENREESKSSKLGIDLTEDQIKVIKSLLDQTGRISIAGTIEGNKLKVGFIACNAPFSVQTAEIK